MSLYKSLLTYLVCFYRAFLKIIAYPAEAARDHVRRADLVFVSAPPLMYSMTHSCA